uniref:Uncharacterized protein n=1 Tax=Solanum tuberosum TaxID=4113 RepID=M1DBI9_SOLTU
MSINIDLLSFKSEVIAVRLSYLAIDTAVIYVAQIRELEQCNVVVKAGVRVDVGAQLGSPKASPVKLRVDPKLNVINSHDFPIVSISQVILTNNLITSNGKKGVTSESRWANRV